LSDPANVQPFQSFLAGRHRPAHARRTAERNAAFFLPHLRPGMRLLDAGCGPGSITRGLAADVAPGATVGIDLDAAAVEAARAAAQAAGAAQVRFEVADIHALPFGDASFDAAFVHAVLQHLPEPLAALREVRRVLRPGGVIGVADADHDSSLMYPQGPLVERYGEILREVRQRGSGGDPRIGKRLRALLHEAGFVRSEASVMPSCDGTDERTRLTGAWWASYIEAPEFVAEAAALGVSDEQELRAVAAALRAWGSAPGAIWATMWCQAVGFVPAP
jgi:SAM-dependent methyltransferase